MKYRKTDNGYIIRLYKGEEAMSSLKQFCADNNIQSGVFHAIGAALSVEMGMHQLDKKEYLFKKFDEPLEIVGITGNIALFQDEAYLHAHGVFSDREMKTVGGHIKEVIVGATCEVYLTDYGVSVLRELDEEIGLNLLKL
jgi:predicted DNA-binding protein with PD1-like motif